MKKGIIIAAGVAMVLTTLLATGCSTYFGSSQTTVPATIDSSQNVGIAVAGVGKLEVVPDIANLVLGVQTQATKVGDAQVQAATSMNAIMAVLTAHQVDSKDIQTQSYSIQPVYQYNPTTGEQTLIGYSVTNEVIIKVRNIADTGSIIDDATAAGGDASRVDSVSFSVDKPETYYTQLRQLAMADAKDRADQLAKLSGVKVGKPISITETGFYTPPSVSIDYKTAEGGVSAETSINPGQTDIQLSVTVVYEIQ